jgi:CheY-specific phosphatase CheX
VNDALYRATVTTFEELAFQFPMPELERSAAGPRTTATVDFAGARRGRLTLSVSNTLLPSIAANMLGDEEPSREEQLDALKEVANVICGNVLPAVAGPTAIFALNAPRLGSESDGAPAAEADVLLMDGSASVRLFLE